MTKKWGIIGLGWLGSELARSLEKAEQEYWGTTRKNFDWERDDFPMRSCDVLFLNTPPLTNMSPDSFVRKIHAPPGVRIIFISSIGVYGNISGIITEKTTPHPHTKNGTWLLKVEELLLEKFKSQTTIIRAGGLIGGFRHPVLSLAKKEGLILGEGYINLIHRNDLIDIILSVSQQGEHLSLVNAVGPYHPLKSEYYNFWCEKLNLDKLQFSVEGETDKIIESVVLDSFYTQWSCPKLDWL
ncbi:MAG: hypothetical protein WDA09_09990 [Bacteriovoracaceae bacterium]